jgi:hypothetical protein
VTVVAQNPAGSKGLRLLLVVLVAAAVAFAVWWFLVRSSSPTTRSNPTGAVAVSRQGLETLAALGRPIYWAGPRRGVTYELTQTPDGRVYVRYLPRGVPVGSQNVYLAIGTYPVQNAYAATKVVAAQAGTVKVHVGDGGIAFYRRTLPTNLFVAFPGSNYQIEVFDPVAAVAKKLVSSGAIQPVKAGTSSAASVPKAAAVAAVPATLDKLSARLGRPIYWAGTESGETYELTQTPDGRVYVRYLPPGVKVGAEQPYLTIATYPMTNAYTTTKDAAGRKGTVEVPIPDGIAFYDASRPTSVYVAFPGVDEQVEVFDPSAAIARATVAAHRIRAVP